jgi:PAS domain S-box-containing protein
MNCPPPLRLAVPLVLLLFGIAWGLINFNLDVTSERTALEARIQRSAQLIGTHTAGMAGYLYEKKLPNAVRMELSLAAASPDLRYALICDASNRILEATRYEWRNRSLNELALSKAAAAINKARVTMTGQTLVGDRGHDLIGVFPFRLGPPDGASVPAGVGLVIVDYGLDYPQYLTYRGVLRRELHHAIWLALLCLGLWYLSHRTITQRAGRLVEATQRLAAGESGVRAALPGGDELAHLAGAFDRMATDIDTRSHEASAANAALRASEARLRLALTSAAMGSWYWDAATRTTSYSEELGPLFGLPRGAAHATYREFLAALHPDDQSRVAATIARTIDQKRGAYAEEYRVLRADGTQRWLAERGQVYRDVAGRLTHMSGVTWDVTEHKATEIALQESATHMQALLDTVVEGIITIDESGFVKSFNPGAERIFGYRREEMLGRKIDTLMPAPYRAEHDRYIKNYLDTGKKKIIGIGREVVGLRKDGTLFPMDLSVGEMRFGARRMFVGVTRDISERKRADEELKSSREQIRAYAQHLDAAVEAERLRMAREIHDDLGQSLTGIKMDLAALRRRLKSAGEVAVAPVMDQKLGDISAAADATISAVRRIASELRPPLLERVGLDRAVQMQCRMFTERTGTPCEIDLSPDIALDETRAIGVYRIFQEAMTNIARHGNAPKVRLRLGESAGRLLLEVHNDGRAITETEANDPHSFGLVGMRERARMLGGTVTIHGLEGAGTTVRLEIPLRPFAPVETEAPRT